MLYRLWITIYKIILDHIIIYKRKALFVKINKHIITNEYENIIFIFDRWM